MYEEFARVYDIFMDNVPYDDWAAWLTGYLRAEGIRDGLVLDLGCGTGRMTRLLAQRGYDMIGADASEEMLECAQMKEWERSGAFAADEEAVDDECGEAAAAAAAEDGEAAAAVGAAAGGSPAKRRPILYLCQDMRSFELYGTVRAIVCVCDGMNYITDRDDLVTVFRLVNNYLDPGGLFLFDLNTPYKYAALLGSNTFAEARDEESFIWENTYDPQTHLNEYDLTLFLEREDGLYERSDETHIQRAWELGEILEAAAEAGLTDPHVFEAYTDRAPGPESERVCVVLRESGKQAE